MSDFDGATPTPPLTDLADRLRRDTIERVLPFWLTHAAAGDVAVNGYVLGHDAHAGPRPEPDRLIVSQTRLAWVFARAHLAGLGTSARDYRAAAESGFEFLESVFRDRTHGGYFWTARDRKPLVRDKLLYGQAFVVFALAELHRAIGAAAPLAAARELLGLIDSHFRDPAGPGWFDRLLPDLSAPPRDAPARKTANAAMHLLEAAVALHAAAPDARSRSVIERCADLCGTAFYPANPSDAAEVVERDGTPVRTPPGDCIVYGHTVEHAWLAVEAADALGRPPDLGRARAALEHALHHGFDTARGGLFALGRRDRPAHERRKDWWPQAELLTCLATLLRRRDDPALRRILAKQLAWYLDRQADPLTGLPMNSLAEDGTVLDARISHAWNAGYHDLRARLAVIELAGISLT